MNQSEAMTACVDCGQQVPTIRAGVGDPTLDRCPRNAGTPYTCHRVPRSEMDAACAEAGVNSITGHPLPQKET